MDLLRGLSLLEAEPEFGGGGCKVFHKGCPQVGEDVDVGSRDGLVEGGNVSSSVAEIASTMSIDISLDSVVVAEVETQRKEHKGESSQETHVALICLCIRNV